MDSETARIRALNDELRQNFAEGMAVMTPGIAALGAEAVARIVKTIAVFDGASANMIAWRRWRKNSFGGRCPSWSQPAGNPQPSLPRRRPQVSRSSLPSAVIRSTSGLWQTSIGPVSMTRSAQSSNNSWNRPMLRDGRELLERRRSKRIQLGRTGQWASPTVHSCFYRNIFTH